MEKRIAHYKLPSVYSLIHAGQVKATASAFAGARLLGINNLADMCKVVLALTSDNFYKSMTTHAAGRIPLFRAKKWRE